MKNSQKTKCCKRRPGDKEMSMDVSGYDVVERAVLHISRCYWQNFATPHSQAWLSGICHAERAFGGNAAFHVLSAVQAMRISRISCFHFNNPACEGCAAIISEHERQFMNTFKAVRAGRMGSAETHAMILCEGHDTRNFINEMKALVDLTCADRKAGRRFGDALTPH